MEATCARAVELGLPAVAFTEHVDHTRWLVAESDRNDPRTVLTAFRALEEGGPGEELVERAARKIVWRARS